ncbi:hypothetical protein ARMSODRAFT_1028122 [Armillaria solidipes]|uniref:Retrotransposon gag domain-containing protein n=1 Tax=Armillaria solidipes TaxID=1076256 RepID=A0A2H3AI54_9AGAR|nr:hypothetical protein ARMSODRAFT_1028122 [Armillaria solidipes]
MKFWNLPDKGKDSDRGQPPSPPIPEWQKPLHAGDNIPWLSIKPIMLQPLKPFKRHHDNIERFLGDCIIYFKAFASYFQLSSQMVPFAASLFKDAAKDWWMYRRNDFWSTSDWDATPA